MQGVHLQKPLVLLLVLAALAGCGGGDDDGAPEGKTVTAKVMTKLQSGVRAQVGQWVADIPVADSEEPAFAVAEVIAPPGNLNLGFKNSTGEQHNLTIEEVGGGSVDTPFSRDTHGKALWLRSSLFEGKKYVFYCALHRKEGMEGTIVVDPKLSAEDLKPY
jgi:plastocyanin